MTNLNKSDLGQPLLAFVFAFYILTIIWAEIRKYHPQVVAVLNTINTQDNQQIVKGRLYRSLVMAFTTIVICFAIYPSVYKAFVPIKALDAIWINLVGILLLFISLVWMVIAQTDFDSEIYSNEMISRKMSDEELLFHGKKISMGYILMFAGITITLANMLSIMLFLFAITVHLYKRD